LRIVSKRLNFFSTSFFFRLEKSHFVDRSRNSSIDFMGLYFLDIYLRISTSFLSIFTGPERSPVSCDIVLVSTCVGYSLLLRQVQYGFYK
jgi:hypothetical protein